MIIRPRILSGWRLWAGLPSLSGLALLAAGCASTPMTPSHSPPSVSSPSVDQVVRIQIMEGNRKQIIALRLEDYIVGSVLAEAALGGLSADAVTNIARLQAVLARTYAVANLGRHRGEEFDLCSDTHCQVYRPPQRYPARLQMVAKAAAVETRGVIITYGGRPIQALFHSDCGGHTSNAGIVWGGPTPPYLLAVLDAAEDVHREWKFDIPIDELRNALNLDNRTRVGAKLDRIDVVQRDIAGRAERVIIDGEFAPMVRGEELRAVITASFGARTIRSTRFEVDLDGKHFKFTGSGFGHGVGLCQVGAMALANRGEPFHQIIRHYYSGVRLEQLERVHWERHRSPVRTSEQTVEYFR